MAVDATTAVAIERLNDDVADLSLELGLLRTLVADDVDAIKIKLGKLTMEGDWGIESGKGRVHRVCIGPPAAPVRWKTPCGWAFASSYYEVVRADGHPSRRGDCCRQQDQPK